MKKLLFTVMTAGAFMVIPVQEISASSYEVNEGDTLWLIAQSEGIEVDELKEANNLTGTMIYPGQSLHIPGGADTHTVQSGDSLWLIANEYGVTVDQLRQLNDISGSDIFPGQTLKVAGADAEQASADLYSEQEKELLARLVHAEAQGEPYEGKVAVAAVVLNRTNSDEFPSSISDVIYETYSSGQIFAFEPVQNGEINNSASATSIRAMEEALAGNDPTNGAVFFYNPDTATSDWVDQLTVNQRIGNHVFAEE